MAARGINEEGLRALALASRHVNASIARPFEEVDLLSWIRSGRIPNDRVEHVRLFIDETDTATLQDLVLSGAVAYGDLARLADQLLPSTHDTRKWLDERRSF